MLKAVILDWAGTAVDYGSCAPAAVFLDVLFRHGVEITMEQARQPMGFPKKGHLQAILQMESVAERWRQVHGRQPNEADVESLYAEFIPLQTACLKDYADVIPGVIEAVAACRQLGMKIGSTTGYTAEMMEILTAEARRQGYETDCVIVPSQVSVGRPAPFMCWQVLAQLNVYPPSAAVKVGDTIVDIEEGLNAGMWAVGVAKTGNELGLSEREILALSAEELQLRLEQAYLRLSNAGAHLVIDSVADLPHAIAEINQRLSRGEKP